MRVCRPYQEDAYGAALRELERVASTILVLPTGTGKTVILAKLVANWNRGNVLLLAHRTELLEQARDKFGAELGYLPVIEQAERGMEPDCLWRGGLVLVASVQTMRNDKRLEKFRHHPFDLIAIDECVTGDTLIHTDQGTIPIKSVPTSGCRSVLTYNDSRPVFRPIRAFLPQGKRPILEITLRSGKTIRCTSNHPLMTSTGWRQAGSLVPGIHLLSLAGAGAAPFSVAIPGDGSAASFLGTNCMPGLARNGKSYLSDTGLPRQSAAADAVDVYGLPSPPWIGSSAREEPGDTRTIAGDTINAHHSGLLNFPAPNDRPSSGHSSAIQASSTLTRAVPTREFLPITEPSSVSGRCTRLASSPALHPACVKKRTADTVSVSCRCIRAAYRACSRSINSFAATGSSTFPGPGSTPSVLSDSHGGLGTTDHAAAMTCSYTRRGGLSQKLTWPQSGSATALVPLPSTRHAVIPTSTLPRPPANAYSQWSSRTSLNACSTSYDPVVSVRPAGEEEVFDITVEGTHSFFANGILAHNCHHAVAKSYRKIVDYFLALNPACKVVGVTATPTRSDETAMGTVFTSCAYQYPICQAIDDGWLTRPRQFLVTVEGVDFSGVRMTRNEFGETDFNQADLEAVLVEEEPLHGLAKPILEQAGGRSGIIFAAGVGHAHLLAAVLNRERQGCAAAVDGTTDKEKRRQLVKDFSEGRLQFLSNFNVFSEGFDCPQASLVVMGRPTKSLLVYTQQLGRVLRPLDGLVDGFADAADRRAAILSSEKPYALCLDFVGNSRHRIVTCADVLGGNYDLAAVDRARRNIGEDDPEGQKPTRPADVIEELKKARAELLLEAEQESRRLVRAQVSYSAHEVNALMGGDVAGRGVERTRGGSSDSQIAFLVNLGVSRQTASGYTRRQASAVIEKLKAQRCTNKQRAILAKFGEPADVNFDQAKSIIDEIASAGWQPRGKHGTEERA